MGGIHNFFVVLIFPVLGLSVWEALGLKRAAPEVCMFCCMLYVLFRWRSLEREHGLTVFPASPFHFAIYLRHLTTEAKTASPLISYPDLPECKTE